MESCGHYQALLLDYLYDLVEDNEGRTLREHLEQCAACQGALITARAQQNLLAAAAKVDCGVVQFEPPAAQEPVRERPRLLTPPAPARRHWGRWAVAAGILLALGGLGLPAAKYGADYGSAKRAVAAHEASLTHKRTEIVQINRQLAELPDEQQEKVLKLLDAFREQQLKLIVSGPETVQPGAPNEYQILTRSLNDTPVPAHIVSARVVDQAGKVVYQEASVASTGTYRLTLPANLPLKPNTRLTLEVIARNDSGSQCELSEGLELAAPLYLTHLTTDKPMYQPGEMVRFRSLTLDRFSLKPADADFRFLYTLTTPLGGVRPLLYGSTALQREDAPDSRLILGPDQKPVRGVGAGDFSLYPSDVGGEYTLTVSEAGNRFPPQQRKFLVNQYRIPSLDKKLDFSRKSYGAGEEVVAFCRATKAGGGAVANRRVEANVFIDGKPYGADGKEGANPIIAQTDAEGAVSVRFKLPATIDRGQGNLSVQFDDGGNLETIVRPIPIVTKKLQVDFFPEGGDLVAGVPNRVYFQVRTTLDKPADLKGRLVTGEQVVASDVQTIHDAEQPGVNQGMGVFEFTPQAGRQYELKIDSPSGIEGRHELPEVKEDGVVLSIPKGVVSSREWINVTVHSPKTDRTLLVGAYCRGRLLDHQALRVQKGVAAEFRLKPGQGVGGVYRISVFEERSTNGSRKELVPLAERLVYRLATERLDMAINLDRKAYIPGDRAAFTVQAVTEKDQPAPALVMVSVVDKSVLTLADEKTARAMPTHFFLTTEVRRPEDLEYADFLLTGHPKAPIALDLLLGTQGWRRFAEQNPVKFREEHKEDAERWLATSGLTGPETLLVAVGKVSPENEAALASSQKKLQQEFGQKDNDLRGLLTTTNQGLLAETRAPEYTAAVVRMNAAREALDRYRTLALSLLAAVLLVAGVVGLGIALARDSVRGLVYSTAAAVGAAVLLAIALMPFAQKSHERAAATKEMAAMAPKEMAAHDARPEMQWQLNNQKDMARPAKADRLAEEIAPRVGGRPLDGDDKVTPDNARMPVPPFAMKGTDAPAPKEALGEQGKATGPGEGKGKQDRDKQDNKGVDPRANAEKLPARPATEREAGRAQQAADAFKALRSFQMGERRTRGGELLEQKAGLEAPRMEGAEELLRKDKAGSKDATRLASLPPPAPSVVREYAHRRTAGAKPALRSDFTETLYWHPVLVLPNGQAEVSFELCDSVTSFQVTAFGHTLDGRLGAVTTTLDSRLPFTLEPKVPIEVTATDKLDIPVSIANNTPETRSVQMRVAEHNGLALVRGNSADQFDIDADKRTRRVYRFQPTLVEGEASLVFEGSTRPFAADTIRRTFRVVPDGFPAGGSRSDLLEGLAQHTLNLPEHWITDTLKFKVQVYPSTLADLQKGLEALLREPHGCFEQTSTSNYPNLLILDYLRESEQSKPEVERRARELLDKGYQKLTSFECPNSAKKAREGYEWFGAANNAHEALTAYGLLQFRDMARVHPVDQAMLERTRQYLMACKDGQGGFKRNARALDTFGRAPDNITNAYIVWALTESGKDDDVDRELTALAEQAKGSKDPYFLALVANSLLNRDKGAEALAVLKTVAGLQKPEGYLNAEKTSITGSGGRALQIETTSLAVLGWLKANRPVEFNDAVQKAVKWLGQQRGGQGGFGSTQSTILALKALIAYASANKKSAEGGEVRLFVNDKEAGQLLYAANAQETLVIDVPQPERFLRAGENKVRVEMTGKNAFPHTVAWSYQTVKPLSADNCPVRLTTRLNQQAANEGETVHLTVGVENVSGKGQGMAVAIIGLPGGLTLPEDMKQLKNLARQPMDGSRPVVSAWETRGRELILYWRDLAPEQKIEVPLALICRVPGEYRGPASRAYLYYDADAKHWIEPLAVTIKAKE